MRNTTGFILALTIGAVGGLGLTHISLGDGPISGSVASGPWQAWPGLGLPDVDPYGRAQIVRTGDLPLGPGEGIAFFATVDSAGARLDGGCRYSVGPMNLPARWWTIAAYGFDRLPIPNSARRAGFSSAEVTRAPDGAATIVIGPAARPGDWLPTAAGRLTLVLRLYDTPLAGSLADNQAQPMPEIRAEGCP